MHFFYQCRLQAGSTENLLSNSQSVYDQLTSFSSYFYKLCTCDQEKTQCRYNQYNQCGTMTRGKEYHCVLHTNSRKRRDLKNLTQFRDNYWESRNVLVCLLDYMIVEKLIIEIQYLSIRDLFKSSNDIFLRETSDNDMLRSPRFF